MKFLILSWKYIKHNIAPIILTSVFIAVSMFNILTLYGQYRYTSFNRDSFAESGLDDAYYFIPMAESFWLGDLTENVRIFYEDLDRFGDAIDLISYRHFFDSINDNELFTVFVYGKRMIECFPLPVDEGRWLDPSASTIEVVLLGDVCDSAGVGDTVTLKHGGEALVVGKIYEPVSAPDFNVGANSDIPADILYTIREEGIFATEQICEVLPEDRKLTNTICSFIEFSEGVSSEDFGSVKDYLAGYGKLVDYDKIIEDSNISIRKWIRLALPLPAFMLIIATINIVCISAIMVKRSMSINSRYFLVGCSVGRSVIQIAVSTAAVFSLPTIFNILSVSFFPNFMRSDNYAAVDYILDFSASWIAIAYMMIVILIVTLIPLVFYKNYSPLDFYRRQI